MVEITNKNCGKLDDSQTNGSILCAREIKSK